MPIQVSEHPLTAKSPDYFAQVLRDDPEARQALRLAVERPEVSALQAVFNGRPVALLLVRHEDDQYWPETLVVHPATRQRGVGMEFARQVSRHLGESLAIPQACHDFVARAGLADR